MLPLVGRGAEIAAIADALAAVRDGVGSVVCVYGEAGIGKTRLSREAVAMARADGFSCAWGEAFADGGMPPLWPWQSVLSQLGDSDMSAMSAVSTGFESGSPSGEIGPQRFAQFRAVVDGLTAAAATQPVLVVLDDAHAADLGTLLLARFAVRTLRAVPVLFVVAARDTADVDPSAKSVLDDLGSEGVLLRPATLSTSTLAGLLTAIDADVAEDQLDQLAGLTLGNPLFVHELLASRTLTRPMTPESMRWLLESRMRRLSPNHRAVVAAVALLGSAACPSLIGAVSAAGPDHVEEALRAAEAAGLLNRDTATVRFTHDLLATAVTNSLSGDTRADLHERAADALQSRLVSSTDRLAAIARHRLAAAAARRTQPATAIAGHAAQAAATHLLSGLAYESASQLLRQAVERYDDLGIAPPVELLLETARSELAAGKLREARVWFRRAAEAATDPVSFAEAALGLGGMWVHEHRQSGDHAVFMAMLERAMAGLPECHADLVARLRVRHAAEQVYGRTGPISAVHLAVDAARSCGRPQIAAEALSLLHHTLLGPANAHQRGAIAEELMRHASAAGDNLMTLMAMLWRTIDLTLVGDPRAERSLNELRERADALQVGAVLFVVEAMDVMRLIRQGSLDEAVAAAQQCFELGSSIGDADAVGYLGAHMLTIRWLQQRPDEMLPMARSIADSPMMVDGDVAYPGAVAVLASMTGDFDEARAALQRVMAGLTRGLETSSNWMISMFCAAEAAALLDDAETARAIYDALIPFADLPIMGSLGVVCFGSAQRTLGLAARTFGDNDLAAQHLRSAVAHNHRLGNPVMAAISEGELGCVLIAGGRGDAEAANEIARGWQHVEASITTMTRRGLHERAARLRAAADLSVDRSPDNPAGSPADQVADDQLADNQVADVMGEVVRRGSVWELRIGDQTVELADTVGVQRLLHLLERPFVDVRATDLVGAVESAGRHDVVDTGALRAYHDRVRELRREIDEADEDNDIARASRRRDELDALLTHLGSSKALAGRSRAFSDGHERARIAVRKSLSRVFEEVSLQAPQFAEELAASIRTGSTCRFHPRNRFPTVWRHTIRDPQLSQ